MECIRRWGVDLDEIWKRSLALCGGYWVEKVHHQVTKFDADHGDLTMQLAADQWKVCGLVALSSGGVKVDREI